MSVIQKPRKCVLSIPLPLPENQILTWLNYCYLDTKNRVLVYGAVPSSDREAWEESFSFETIFSEQDDAALSQGKYTLKCETSPAPHNTDDAASSRTPFRQAILSITATPSMAQLMPCDMGLMSNMTRLAYRDIAATQKGFISPQYRHVKRGTLYCVRSFSLLQLDGPDDMALMVSYADHDQLWTRRVSEFYDGRFQAVAT